MKYWSPAKDVSYPVFRRMEFNSDRKRMSIVLKDPNDGKYKLYIKGADSIIKDRLDPNQIDNDIMQDTEDFLSRASLKGLRTLLMGMRVLEETELKDFMH
jgi:phospholipid-transporting ATPase